MSFLPMRRPAPPPLLGPQQQPPNRMRQLAQAMMAQPAQPVYNAAGAIAALGTPLVGGVMSGIAGRQEAQQQQASRDALQQAIRDAAEAEGGPLEQRRVLMTNLAGQGMEMPQATQIAQAYYPDVKPEKARIVGGMQQDPATGEWSPIPGYVEQQAAIREAGAPVTNVKLPAARTKEDEAVGTWLGEQYTGTQDAAAAAAEQNAQLARVEDLLAPVETGRFTPLRQAGMQALRALGVDVDEEELGRLEASEALSNQMALSFRNTASGAGMPGAMSDKDREFLVAMAPSLRQTPEGRRLMIETMRKINDRKIELARLARRYRDENGTFAGFEDVAAQYNAENPIFTNEDFAEQEKVLAGVETITPTAPPTEAGVLPPVAVPVPPAGAGTTSGGTGWRIVE